MIVIRADAAFVKAAATILAMAATDAPPAGMVAVLMVVVVLMVAVVLMVVVVLMVAACPAPTRGFRVPFQPFQACRFFREQPWWKQLICLPTKAFLSLTLVNKVFLKNHTEATIIGSLITRHFPPHNHKKSKTSPPPSGYSLLG